MFVQLLLQLLICLASASALPNQERYHYKRQAGYARSPCPGMNTLANHGYINRDGRNINLNDLRQAVMDVYNVDYGLAEFFVGAGNLVVQNSTLNGILVQTIDLDAYDKHDAIEHDASLTRKDASQGDNHSFQPDMLQAMLNDSPSDYLDIMSLAKTRVRRERAIAARGLPQLDFKGNFLAFGEVSLILQAFGKGNNQAPKSDVSTWFTDERLPDGYVKSVNQINMMTTVALSGEIQAAAGFWRMFSKKLKRGMNGV